MPLCLPSSLWLPPSNVLLFTSIEFSSLFSNFFSLLLSLQINPPQTSCQSCICYMLTNRFLVLNISLNLSAHHARLSTNMGLTYITNCRLYGHYGSVDLAHGPLPNNPKHFWNFLVLSLIFLLPGKCSWTISACQTLSNLPGLCQKPPLSKSLDSCTSYDLFFKPL